MPLETILPNQSTATEKQPIPVTAEDVLAQEDKDALELARAGKKQILKRRFGLLSAIGFSSSLMITWEALLPDFLIGLQNGGPAGLIYGFLVAWVGILSVFICMSELASMLPSAGGQYHFTSMLAPQNCKKFLSYVTGWVSMIAWVAGTTATSFLTGTLIQELIAINHPSYSPQGWQGTLLMWAVLLICTGINVYLGVVLPAIEVLILILHVLGFFATLIPLAYIPRHGSAKDIFTLFFNEGGWSTTALSFFVGWRGNITPFLGLDGTIHMAEEIRNSSRNVPRSMITAIIINGVTGFSILLVLLFAAGPLQDLAHTDSAYPFINIYATALDSVGAATTLTSVVVIMNACAAIATLSSSSRLMWSFARERALPGWRVLRKVNPHTSIPNRTVAISIVASALIGLINIGSSKALNDILSIIIEAFFCSYFISIFLLLYRRLKGDIAEPLSESDQFVNSNLQEVPCSSISNGSDISKDSAGITTSAATVPEPQLRWGPWHIKGWLGTLNNIFACCFLLVAGFFGFWPPAKEVTAENMNYGVVVLGAVSLGSMVYYFGWARKKYKGPVVEV